MFAQSADALALKLIRSLLRVETESDSQLPRIDSQTAIRIQLFRALHRQLRALSANRTRPGRVDYQHYG